MSAAFSRWTDDRGPVRRRVLRRFERSVPSRAEKTEWLGEKLGDESTLYEVPAVMMVDSVVVVPWVEVDEVVSFLKGGEADGVCSSGGSSSGSGDMGRGRFWLERASSVLGKASRRLGAGCILSGKAGRAAWNGVHLCSRCSRHISGDEGR